MAGPTTSRSSVIEAVLRDSIEGRTRGNAREAIAIKRHAAALNAEMADVLTFQARAPTQGTS